MKNNELTQQWIASIRVDQAVRIETAAKNHFMFFHIYLAGHVKYPIAPFHSEMFGITQQQDIKIATIMAFRGSAKSTIFSFSYPIWAVTGEQQCKHIWLISQTQPQAKLLLANIRAELEDNELLRADLGPFEEQDDEWGASSIVIPKYGARITAASIEQSVRGLRHRASRPDLIIIDDMENLASVKTHESRTKTYEWLTGEIFPAGDKDTRFILIGNYLHEESAIARVAQSIQNGERRGRTLRVPILEENGVITWIGKYPDIAAVEAEKALIGDNRAFQREYMLISVGVNTAIIKPDWITYYDELPGQGYDHRHLFSAIGIDLAIVVSETSDFTAMVSAHIYKIDGKVSIYILPSPINKRMEFPETVITSERLSKSVWPGSRTRLYIEDVGYQASIIQTLKNKSYHVVGFKPQGQDKASRLALTTPAIVDGTVLFPRSGTEDLLRQLVGFGSERHDDLADAFAILVLLALEDLDRYTGSGITIGSTKGTVFDTNRRMQSRGFYNVATASDEDFFNSPTGRNVF